MPDMAQRERVTSIWDIARIAGVSHQTVSRVINGKPHVKASTRELVLRTIDELGYTPSKTARALAGGTAPGLLEWPAVKGDRNLKGPLSVAVPGHVDGMRVAHETFGTLPWADLLEPAVRIAESGLPVDWFTTLSIAVAARELAESPGARKIYLPGGLPPAAAGPAEGCRSRPASRERSGPGPLPGHEAEQAQRPFLLEFQRTGRQRADPPDPAAEFGYLHPYPWLGQDPQAERQRGGADVVSLLDLEGECHRGEVVIAELPMARTEVGGGAGGGEGGGTGHGYGGGPGSAAAGRGGGWPPAPGGPAGGRRFADRREQAEKIAVAQHPRRGAEPLGGLRDAHR